MQRFPENKFCCAAAGPKCSEPAIGCPPTKRIFLYSGEHIIFKRGDFTLPVSVKIAVEEIFGRITGRTSLKDFTGTASKTNSA